MGIVGCTSSRHAESAECTFNGDCTDPLVCAAGYCRAQCAGDRDCQPGWTCNASSEPSKSVCLPPDSPQLCAFNSQCPANATCGTDHACHSQCQTDADCHAIDPSATCSAGACTLPIHTPPAMDGGVADAGSSDTGTPDTSSMDVQGIDGPSRDVNCATGLSYCAAIDSCVDLQTTLTDCGACGHVCAPGQACLAGVCSCSAPRVMCDDSRCIDLQTDRVHCGDCGTQCATFEDCSNGHCVPDNFGWCNGTSTDLRIDAQNCGSCGNACSANGECANGVCCQAGMNACGASCVNFQTDSTHCGACTNTCAPNDTCIAGTCHPANDECAGALPVTLLPTGTTTFSVDLSSATASPNTCSNDVDVFYSITLPGPSPEIVEIDTFDPTSIASSTLGYAPGGCAGIGVRCALPGQCACGSGGACPSRESQLVLTLAPGTHVFSVETGLGGSDATVNIRHVPVPSLNGILLDVPLTPATVTTMGTLTGGATPTCSTLDDQWLYWATCPGQSTGTLTVSICESGQDVTASLVHAGAGGGMCTAVTCTQNFTASIPSGPDLHVLSVDAATAGMFTIRGAFTSP